MEGGEADTHSAPDLEDLDLRPRETTKTTLVGKARIWSDLERIEIIFLVISVTSILGTLGLTIERLISAEHDSDDYTFALLVFINSFFCLLYIVDGVFREQCYELFVFVAAVSVILTYCVINFVGDKKSVKNYVKIARLVLIVVVGPVLVVLGVYIGAQYYKSRNLIYRTVGAITELQDEYAFMLAFEALLKFDFQTEISIIVLVLSSNGIVDVSKEEKAVLAAGIPYALLWVILGYIAMRWESHTLTWVFVATSVLEPAYIIYKLAVVKLVDETNDQILWLGICIIFCGIMGLIIRFSLIVIMIFKIRVNFGKGLKEKVYGDQEGERQPLRP